MNRFGLKLLCVLVVVIAAPLPVALSQQAGRIEIHPLESPTLSDQQFLTGSRAGKPATIGGELRLPPGTGRFSAVILVHGSGGIGGNVDRWAQQLNGIGVAVFILDSFTGRGIAQTVTDQSQLGSLAMIADSYRALGLLAKHGRIDPSKIALMGFSKGGDVALHASLKRFQRMYAPPGVEFSAFIPFYAPCNITYLDDTQVSDRPIRMFHGAADDYVPVQTCQDYVKRLQAMGKDVQLTIYDGARHAFDNPLFSAVQQLPDAQVRTRKCRLQERDGGQFINIDTQKPFTFNDSCTERGATIGYNEQATNAATKAVTEFLASLWNLKGN